MKGSQLDLWLSRGYYRMQQRVDTCQFVVFDDAIYAVQWLRLALADIRYEAGPTRLLRRNSRFSATIRPFVLTEAMEVLYNRYWNAIDFEAPESVEACLLGGAGRNAFDTWAIELRDHDRLIAVGVFDKGAHSIAGILNFYHPDYRRYSLGKYLMLLKINYARAQGMAYYYPGYVVHKYPKFDYKLYPCPAATEIYDSRRNRWLPFSWEAVDALSVTLLNELQANYPNGELQFPLGGQK